MNVTGLLESAELQFKQILEEFFISVYDEKSLLSHGIDHHRRVWSYAKELVINIFNENVLIDPVLPKNLIISCYLHDIGMSVDRGIKHGHHSKELCREFLMKNNIDEDSNKYLLSAIENHDNKEYKTSTGPYDLLTILSVADDFDAFGFTGIYRYSEIYLARGIIHKELGNLIMKNASQRFENFLKTFGTIDAIVLKQSERYNILKEFFNSYNIQVQTYTFDGKNPKEYCGVIELFSKMIDDKKGLEKLYFEVENNSEDQVIKWFFKNLKYEISL